MEQKWLFDTGAGLMWLSLNAFRTISNDYIRLKINSIGTSTKKASGSTIIPEGVFKIPMEWNGKRIMQQVQVYRNLPQQTILDIDGNHNLGIK
jgi:hypothetical protein